MGNTEETRAVTRDRVFLVVVDDSPERGAALRYACLRAREGDPREGLMAQIEEDPRISTLVLAAAAAAGTGPGPLVAALAGHHPERLRVPMTVVPGTLDDEALDRVT